MKKTSVILFAAALAGVTVFEGCKKYEEGPGLSFRSREERVANTWEVEKVYEGGVEVANPEGTVTFDKDGGFSATYTSFGISITLNGTWQLVNDDEDIEVKVTSNGITNTTVAKILKLKEKEFWVKDLGDTNDPADDVETHYKPAN